MGRQRRCTHSAGTDTAVNVANAEDQILAPARIPLRVGAWIEHDKPVGPTSGRPRILLLTQAFPPRTEIGATRWEGFAPFLADAGWGIDVVIEHPKDLPNPDWTRFARLPNDVRVAAAERKRPRFFEVLTGFRRATQLASGKHPCAERARWSSTEIFGHSFARH